MTRTARGPRSHGPAGRQRPGPHGPARRRRRLVLAALGVTAVGLVTTAVGPQVIGAAADPLGGALYAALAYVVVAVLAPRVPPLVIAAIAFAGAAAVELAQLTGVPAVLADAWPPVRYLLGTSFDAWDLPAYAVGAAGAAAVDAAASPRLRTTTR